MIRGSRNLAGSPEDYADRGDLFIEWVRGRRGSLLGFAADGRLVYRFQPLRDRAFSRLQRTAPQGGAVTAPATPMAEGHPRSRAHSASHRQAAL